MFAVKVDQLLFVISGDERVSNHSAGYFGNTHNLHGESQLAGGVM